MNRKAKSNRYCVNWKEQHQNCAIEASTSKEAIKILKNRLLEWDWTKTWDWSAQKAKPKDSLLVKTNLYNLPIFRGHRVSS